MLYPKEDRDNSTLMFACRTCTFAEPASSSCVFRNILYNTVGETAGVTQDVGSDPTVGTSNSDSDYSNSDSDFPSNFGLCILCGEEISCSVCGESVSECARLAHNVVACDNRAKTSDAGGDGS